MTQSASSPPPAKPRPPGLISSLIFVMIKMVLLSLLSWFLLLLWFLGETIFRSPFVAEQHAQSIIQFNAQFITVSSFHLVPISALYSLFQSYLLSCKSLLSGFTNPWIRIVLDFLLTVSEITVTRFILFLKGLLLLLLILVVFLIDGLVKRDIRKFKAARETSFLFHRSKHLLGFLLFVPFLLYMSSPLLINPVLYLLIQSLLLGIVTHVSAAYFKKYL